MTKLTKSVLMTIFSAILIVLTALGIMLTAPATAKAEELPDYLNWTRTEAKAGDLLANRYVLFSKNELKEDYELMISACDVGLIFLDHRFTIPNFPSRLLAYMQAGLPVLQA